MSKKHFEDYKKNFSNKTGAIFYLSSGENEKRLWHLMAAKLEMDWDTEEKRHEIALKTPRNYLHVDRKQKSEAKGEHCRVEF